MPDTSKCFSLVRGRMMRVTRLNACGERVLGPTSTVTSEGFITVALSPETEEGETISVTNAAGKVCILDEPAPSFTGYTVEVNFCGVNPDLIDLMTGNPVVKDSEGVGVGFRVNSGVDLSSSGFALEVWSSVPAATCEGGVSSYGYFLVPFVKGGLIGDVSIGNDAVNFTLTGAKTRDGSGWGVGPYDVVLDESDEPGPLLEAIDAKDHLHVEVTNVAPPEEVCGASALGVPATGATAGIPATLTPANSYPPEDLADAATGFTATPGTAWTTGQYVTLGDGSKANWNGTAWEAGVA
jgi:hypothetical protein